MNATRNKPKGNCFNCENMCHFQSNFRVKKDSTRDNVAKIVNHSDNESELGVTMAAQRSNRNNDQLNVLDSEPRNCNVTILR